MRVGPQLTEAAIAYSLVARKASTLVGHGSQPTWRWII
jgi:hypothetical protein